jgi:hypothetical protein
MKTYCALCVAPPTSLVVSFICHGLGLSDFAALFVVSGIFLGLLLSLIGFLWAAIVKSWKLLAAAVVAASPVALVIIPRVTNHPPLQH